MDRQEKLPLDVEDTVSTKPALPFLNWLGGKRQLLPHIRKYYPNSAHYDANVYIEPFLGGGAVFFDIASSHSFEKIIINDFDPNPINVYKIVRDRVDEFIELLQETEQKYNAMSYDEKGECYYSNRDEFNTISVTENPMRKAVLMMFLNKVSFNSLYRMNSKGGMNAPWGKDTRKHGIDFQNIKKVHHILHDNNVIIENTSYENLFEHYTEKTFSFFDPPYRPISTTANFNRYGNGKTQDKWDDNAQLQLRDFIHKISEVGGKFLMTNSDPKNTNPEDNFFEEAYEGYVIDRFDARRAISAKAATRKPVKELFINNIS